MTTTLERLVAAGMLLHGPEWQRALARDLAATRPSGRLDSRQVRRWVAGSACPDWLDGALAGLLVQAAARRREEARKMEVMAKAFVG